MATLNKAAPSAMLDHYCHYNDNMRCGCCRCSWCVLSLAAAVLADITTCPLASANAPDVCVAILRAAEGLADELGEVMLWLVSCAGADGVCWAKLQSDGLGGGHAEPCHAC